MPWGVSVTEENSVGDVASSRPARVLRSLAVGGTASTVVVVDGAAKNWAQSALDTPVYLTSWLRLAVSSNAGAAFSLGAKSGITPLLALASTAAVLAAILVVGPRVRELRWFVVVALFEGGAAGNLVDRLVRGRGYGRGSVVDFIDVSWFASFNLADVSLTFSVLLGLLFASRRRAEQSGKEP